MDDETGSTPDAAGSPAAPTTRPARRRAAGSPRAPTTSTGRGRATSKVPRWSDGDGESRRAAAATARAVRTDQPRRHAAVRTAPPRPVRGRHGGRAGGRRARRRAVRAPRAGVARAAPRPGREQQAARHALDREQAAASGLYDQLQTDAVVEQQAREQFGLIKPGELPLSVLPAPPATALPTGWPFDQLQAILWIRTAADAAGGRLGRRVVGPP